MSKYKARFSERRQLSRLSDGWRKDWNAIRHYDEKLRRDLKDRKIKMVRDGMERLREKYPDRFNQEDLEGDTDSP